MILHSFADRYAHDGISPGSEIVLARQNSTSRIIDSIESNQIVDLVALYFGRPASSFVWFIEQFRIDDPSFSAIHNDRESRVLAAIIIASQLSLGNSIAILATRTASVSGAIVPPDADWLIDEARDALLRFSATSEAEPIETKLKVAASRPKLTEEITAVGGGDWTHLVDVIGNLRAEGLAGSRTLASQASEALGRLSTEVAALREETQILWWLTGEHCRQLDRHFSEFSQGSAAILAGIDLGDLTTVSPLGPIAAPTILGRMIRLARKEKTKGGTYVEWMEALPIENVQIPELDPSLPARLFPITTALTKLKQNGAGHWQTSFEKDTQLPADMSFDPVSLATQVYHEHLLGQLL